MLHSYPSFIKCTTTNIHVFFRAWNQAEKALARRALAAYQPVPISANPEYLPSDVTVLVCTVNTLLARCLRTWLANDPLEVIIVTIAEHEEQIRSVVANAELSESDLAKVTVLVSEIKGKRMQTITGLAHVHGSIIANVDDHITWHPEFLKHMLPCFDNERVGAASPTIEAIIPEHRRDPNVITPYEAAAMRVIWERTPRQKVAWSTARWIFGLTGVTYLMRADIMKVRVPSILATILKPHHDYGMAIIIRSHPIIIGSRVHNFDQFLLTKRHNNRTPNSSRPMPETTGKARRWMSARIPS